MKYIWQGCFIILFIFISYALVTFIFDIEENTTEEIQTNFTKTIRAYQSNGIDGKALFMEKCASCHHPMKNSTGPALMGAAERAPNKKILYQWIRNSQKVLASGDRYYKALYIAYGKAAMNLFPDLTDNEIEAILLYTNAYKQAIQPATTAYK
jgi:mono/diheme cytochrome c family protein